MWRRTLEILLTLIFTAVFMIVIMVIHAYAERGLSYAWFAHV